MVSNCLLRIYAVFTMPSVSLLIPWSNIFSLVLSNAPSKSPSGGPSLTSLSRESASARIGLFPIAGRLLAEAALLPGVIFVASLFDLARLC